MTVVSAIVVTRGDQDLEPILDSLVAAGFSHCMVWDNSEREDLCVYGRYAAIEEVPGQLIYVQDDDCILPPESIRALLDRWMHEANNPAIALRSDFVVCNHPDHPEPWRHRFYDAHALVGFGAVFQRDQPRLAFERFWATSDLINGLPADAGLVDEGKLFHRCCDVVFTALTQRVLMDVPYSNLPWAENDDRMYRQPGHVAERQRMLDLVRKARHSTVGGH